jgi:uncharacterized membrane protein YesL
MIAGLRAWWRGLRHLNHRGYIYIWANLCVMVLSLPVVTAPAAWAGLMRMSYQAHRTESADINDFWQGFKENLGRGLILALLNLVIVGVNVINLYSYRDQSGLGIDLMRMAWLLALLLWVTIQLLLWPLFYEMERPSLLGAMRNAAVMILLNPGFIAGLWIGLLLIIIASMVIFPAWALLTVSALAAISTTAVLDRLEHAGHPIARPGE